jgi:hypothetical protein
MHLNGNTHQRPNLMAGNATLTPNKSGRILADMEGQSASPKSRTSPPKRKAALWWSLATLGVAAAAFSIIPRPSPPKALAPVKPVAVQPVLPPAPITNAASVAVIVDASPAPSASDSAEPPPQAAPLSSATTQHNTLDQVASIAAPESAKPAVQSQPRPAKQVRASTGKNANKNKDQEDLLGTLLGLIEGKRTPDAAAKPVASAPQTMDELVAKLDAEQQQRAEEQRKALEAVADKPKPLKR